jgi:hypothetical protein
VADLKTPAFTYRDRIKENFGADSRPPQQESTPGPLKYKRGGLTIQP